MKRFLPVVVVIAASCASQTNPNAPPPTLKVGNYGADVGPTPVGVIPTALLHDAQRNKDVDVSIEYPTRGGPFPLIVFSHGYGSSNQGYEPLISYWTSNGYVCIRPAHADAGALREAMRDERNPMENMWDREREPQWRNRVEDIKLVLDSLDELERRFPELRDKMDRSRIGVGGHSYGAFTTMLIAGMRPLQIADARVRAAIAMSPQGIASNRGTTAQSWAGVRNPIMYMTGTNDRGPGEGEDANWRKQAFDYSPAGDKFFVLIDGARHRSFVGGLTPIEPLGSPRNPQPIPNPRDPYGRTTPTETPPQQRGAVGFASERRIFQIIKVTSLAFWDAYLKNDSAARELLQPEKYETSLGGAHLTAK